MPDPTPGHRGATDHAREVSLLAEALCTCSQNFGRHAVSCPTTRLSRSPVGVRDPQTRRALSDALAAHDRRVLAEAEEFCVSCGESLDPANMLRVNGIPYHLGNCPRPHGEAQTP